MNPFSLLHTLDYIAAPTTAKPTSPLGLVAAATIKYLEALHTSCAPYCEHLVRLKT